ncbi:hypothetical protein PMIT1342_00824 [Prochlorococcus marinus str. MIT 1342]|nr:hypothetical protein PMIT1342_00824 [Prochlorococcus marinus str. MIT 1342]
MGELIKRYLFVTLKRAWLRGNDGIQGFKPFEREDFVLKVVSLLRLMGFDGETCIDCRICTYNYNSTGRDIV